MRKTANRKENIRTEKDSYKKQGDEKALYFMDLFYFFKFFILFLETGTELAI